MKIKLGFFIEEHIAKLVAAVADSYEEFDSSFFVYKNYQELYELLDDKQSDLDAVVLHGQIDYWRVQDWGSCQKPLYYISCRGASLFKVFCALLSQKYSISDMSIDTLSSADFDTALEETGISGKRMSFLPADFHRPLAEYVDFHVRSYKAKKSKIALTASGFVCQALEQQAIPCRLITPVRVSMRTVFNRIIADFRIGQLEDRQVAVQVLEYTLFNTTDEFTSPLDIYAKELSIGQNLLEYTRGVRGSLKSVGNGRFFIFTTKGMIKMATDNFTSIPADEVWGKQLRACGIGVGKDTCTAEINALVAMQHALDHAQGAFFVLDEDKKLWGPLGNKVNFELSYNSEFLQKLSSRTSISITTLGKIISFFEQNDYQAVSSQELAVALNILPRSARRILATLENDGVMQVQASENLVNKGRPRILYRLAEDL